MLDVLLNGERVEMLAKEVMWSPELVWFRSQVAEGGHRRCV